MKFVADKMNLDIFEIIKVAKTKPYGFRPFNPGPGIGGHCIPIDPYYLSWIANKKKIKTVNPLSKLFTPEGEFTILEEPIVAVTESKKPAVAADKKNDKPKKMVK